jgi:hypothetical protein
VHLRWRQLKHGPEFWARVRALLHSARFPHRGGWPPKTHRILREQRKEVRAWAERQA